MIEFISELAKVALATALGIVILDVIADFAAKHIKKD